MASKAELKGKATLNTRAFQNKMRRLKRSVRMNMQSLKTIGGLGKKALKGVTVSAAAAVGAFVALQVKTSMYVETLRRQTSMTGLAIKQQQKLNYLSEQMGVQQEAMSDAVKEASMRMSEMAMGGAKPAEEAVDALGTTAGKLAKMFNKDVGEALTFVSKRMQGLGRGEQGMIVDQLFGGQGGEQIRRMLVQNTEAIGRYSREAERVTFMTPRMVKNTIDLNKAFSKMQRVISQVGMSIMASNADELRKAFAKITEKVIELRKKGKFVEWLQSAGTGVLELAKIFITRFRKLVAFWKGVAGGIKKIWNAAQKYVEAYVLTLVGTFKKAWVNIKAAGEVAFYGLREVIMGALAAIVEKAVGAVNKVIKAINKLPKVDIDLVGRGIGKGLREQADKAGQDVEDALNKRKAKIQAIQKAFFGGALEAAKKSRKELTSALEPLLSKQTKMLVANEKTRERINKAQEKLTQFLEKAKMDTEGKLKNEKNETGELKKQTEEMRKQQRMKQPLRGIFGKGAGLGVTKFDGRQPKRGGGADKGNRTEQEQLKVQRKMADLISQQNERALQPVMW